MTDDDKMSFLNSLVSFLKLLWFTALLARRQIWLPFKEMFCFGCDLDAHMQPAPI